MLGILPMLLVFGALFSGGMITHLTEAECRALDNFVENVGVDDARRGLNDGILGKMTWADHGHCELISLDTYGE